MVTNKGLRTKSHDYDELLVSISELLEESRKLTVRSVNTVITATYWEIGKRIVKNEQGGAKRAEYGTALLERLGKDLTNRFGRGFSPSNLLRMRRFFLVYSRDDKSATVSPEFSGTKSATALPKCNNTLKLHNFPLPWAHYVRLMSIENPDARKFYEDEAIRGGWSARQLNRQIGSQFYQRTLLSKDKLAMLEKVEKGEPFNAQEEIKSPYILEFLDLKDEYSESDLEEALVHKLQDFLLELGSDFTFVGRQRRLRIGDQWFRVDLLFFHRKLRCLVIIELKLTEFNHADAGQMHMYLNYARENWTHPDENPPVGLILCAEKNEAVAHYALDGLPNQIMAAEYRTTLPDEKLLADELNKTRALLTGNLPHKNSSE